MKRCLASLLVDPVTRDRLQLEVIGSSGDDVLTGTLASKERRYRIESGIPRLVTTEDVAQEQTSDSFEFKWKKQDTYGSAASLQRAREWCVDKYGFDSADDWTTYFDSRDRILDVGCGSGFTASLWLDSKLWTGRAMWVGVDISRAIDVAQERLGNVPNTHYVQGDALELPFADGSFDTVYSEGVLHHTPSTRAAILSAARVLAPKGELQFYVYRKKAPVREFTDDYIRQQISTLSNEEAWEALRPLTELGRLLHEAHTNIEVPADIPLLGIHAGRHDLQRLIYWHVAKLYWHPDLSFEENLHINFDWYRPHYCHRHTAEEIREWCGEAHLRIQRFHEQESGFTVRAVRV